MNKKKIFDNRHDKEKVSRGIINILDELKGGGTNSLGGGGGMAPPKLLKSSYSVV